SDPAPGGAAPAAAGRSSASAPSSAGPARPVCGRAILHSPYDYGGTAGPYRSGTAGLPTYGSPSTAFPAATAGMVLAAGTRNYPSYELRADTVYYLLPGSHVGSFQARTNDAFVGGYLHGTSSILTGNYAASEPWAIDSNYSDGDQPGVTIEYLTIEKFRPGPNAAAVNLDSNLGWTITHNTVTLNVPGAGILAGTGNTLTDNCLTRNGQYGFQSSSVNPWGNDSLTGGPYDVTVVGNEVSYNDTCDYEGLLNNSAIGWRNRNPVPLQYRNAHCGTVVPDGDEGGFKLWRTDGVTVAGNDVHNNWGPGAWVDTDNANTTFHANTFEANEGAAIVEEISYNFAITDNVIGDNDWADGLNNAGFPQPAIYVDGSGSPEFFGGVGPCPEAACAQQRSYPRESVISGNTLVDNGGNIFLFQDSGRTCAARYDAVCTLVHGGPTGPFTISACTARLPSAAVSMASYLGASTGSPKVNWWDGCQWETASVRVTGNTIDFNPADVPHCNHQDWPDCGAGGMFSEYGSPNNGPGWVVATEVTFFRQDSWSDNTYNGPSAFFAWNQGNEVSWQQWTGRVASGDKCSTAQDRKSGQCTGPFGQDAGSTFNPRPTSKNAPR
ncbi:MAG: right-handed parallel beta-helix repeat-containing protein, partial [Streptosporangiaceae bacterium]